MSEQAIEISHLDYTYPDGTRALADITLDVRQGETLGLIGSNGAGKSTLLLHLNGILQGSCPIRIMSTPVTPEHLILIRRQVGMVFQDPDHQLFMPTVFDDVSFGPVNMGMGKEAIKASVSQALTEVDVLPLAGRSSHHLSVGEKRRVSIATVLSMNPDIIVLDEPSSNLDPRHRRELIDLLNRLSMTKIIATHDLPLVWDTCDRVALMDGGRLCAVGETRAILTDEDLMEKHDLRLPVVRMEKPGSSSPPGHRAKE